MWVPPRLLKVELWANEKLDWLRKSMVWPTAFLLMTPWGDCFGLIAGGTVRGRFPALDQQHCARSGCGEIVALDGKTRRRSGGVDATALPLVSAENPTRSRPSPRPFGSAIRSHWSVEKRLRGYMAVSFNDDQMRARSGRAAHNLAVLRHITLNLLQLDPVKRKAASRHED